MWSFSGHREKNNRDRVAFSLGLYFCFVLWSLIATLFSNLLLCLCQSLPFSWVAGTSLRRLLDTMTLMFLLTPPLFWLLLSLTAMLFSLCRHSLCPTSPNCSRQPVYENNQIIKCLNHFDRFLSCLQSQFKSSFSVFKIGGLQKYFCVPRSLTIKISPLYRLCLAYL